LGNYDYLAAGRAGRLRQRCRDRDHWKIKPHHGGGNDGRPALIEHQARAYEAAVNASRKGKNDQRNAQFWLYEVQNGNHIESFVNTYPQLVVIQPHAQKAFDLLVDHVESNAPLPPSQCIPKGETISPNPAEAGHCGSLFVP
jgi:hypothetical protein